jgi:hypothetical protein
MSAELKLKIRVKLDRPIDFKSWSTVFTHVMDKMKYLEIDNPDIEHEFTDLHRIAAEITQLDFAATVITAKHFEYNITIEPLKTPMGKILADLISSNCALVVIPIINTIPDEKTNTYIVYNIKLVICADHYVTP